MNIDTTLLIERIDHLCALKGIKRNTAFIESGVGKNFKSNLATSKPSMGKITMLANFFGVSVDYLLGKEKSPIPQSNAIVLDHENIHTIPVYETVSAGFGALAIDEAIDHVAIYIANPSEVSDTICIKVKGDSMSPHIEDGDLVQVHKQDSVDSGSIAVMLLDGEEGLVKRVIYGSDWIELHSINPAYEPMRFEGADVMRLRTLGLVKKIIKNGSSLSGTARPAPELTDDKKELLNLIGNMDADQLKKLEEYADFLLTKKQQ